MTKKREPESERVAHVTIRSCGKTEKPRQATFATWKYYSVLEFLRWLGADRSDALDAAKWCARTARPGDRRELAPGITMEVTEE